MANPFAITAASNTILLDSQRQGQTTFTVTNLLGRPLRGRARLVTQQPDAVPWLSIIGEAERDIPIAGTQQYAVQVTVPASGPAGGYSFRLDMIGVENPDELFTEGPTVSFSVPEPEVKKPWPAWLPYALIGGVVVLIILVIVAIVATRPPTPTPIPPCPALSIVSLTVNADKLVTWNATGGCAPFKGTLTARYLDQGAPYRTSSVDSLTGEILDKPPLRCEGTFTIIYTLVLTDSRGQTAQASATTSVTFIC